MVTAQVIYLGKLRTRATHVRSGNSLLTDAPVDNKGKGEYFSPTDSVATALATCMLTTMGIAAEAHGIGMDNTRAEVLKHMGSGPRRIIRIDVKLEFPKEYEEKEKTILEKAALSCPVALSLHPDIEQVVNFSYGVV